MTDTDTGASRLLTSSPDEARLLFRYVTVEEWRDYRSIMAVFADTFFAEYAPDDVAFALADAGLPIDGDVVADRLEQLRRWGNLDASSSVGSPASLTDYYRRRNRYVISAAGQEVHGLVEGVLTRVDQIRDVSPGRLRAVRDALDALLALNPAVADPSDIADAVRAVFDPHREFTDEVTQFFAAVNQWQTRFDLDPTEFKLFAEVLVGYVGDRLDEIARSARPLGAKLSQLEPALPALLERMSGGLAARVEQAGMSAQVTVSRQVGADRADWDHLAAWFRSEPGQLSRIDQLGRDAVAAIRTLTLNLTRLSRLGVGSSSRRHEFLRLAAAFNGASDVEACHRIAGAALGLFPARHLGVLAADADDPVPTSSSWWTAPRAPVAVSLRQRGTTSNRGAATPLRDRTQELELLRRRRETELADRRHVDAELTAVGHSLDGAELSEAALERLEQLMGRASHLRGRGVHRTGTDAGLTCTMTTQAGHNTVITSPAGRLTLLDTVVVVEPHAEGVAVAPS